MCVMALGTFPFAPGRMLILKSSSRTWETVRRLIPHPLSLSELVNQGTGGSPVLGRCATVPQGLKIGQLHRAGRFARHPVIARGLALAPAFFWAMLRQPLEKSATVATERAGVMWASARDEGGPVDRAATRTGARGRKGDIGSNCTWGGLYDRLFHINSLAPSASAQWPDSPCGSRAVFVSGVERIRVRAGQRHALQRIAFCITRLGKLEFALGERPRVMWAYLVRCPCEGHACILCATQYAGAFQLYRSSYPTVV